MVPATLIARAGVDTPAPTEEADMSQIMSWIGNYDNLDEPVPIVNRPGATIAIVVTFTVLVWLSVGFRLYTRFRIICSPGWDDVFLMLFVICGTAHNVMIALATQYGMGSHFLLVEPEKIAVYGKLLWAANACYCTSAALIKLSLLFQFLRVFPDPGPRRTFCISMIVVTALWGTAFSFMGWFPCFPLGDFENGTCYGFNSRNVHVFLASYIALGASNMLLDIIILLTPLPLLWRRNTQRNTKLGLLALFSMGGIVAFLSIWRLAVIIQSRASTYPTFDPTWYGTIIVVLANLEVDVASICASVPVFWPILSAKLDQIFVVKEVSVSRSRPFSSAMAEDDDEEIEMGAAHRLPYSRASSEENLTRKGSTLTTTGTRAVPAAGVNAGAGPTPGKKTYYSDTCFTNWTNWESGRTGQYVESEFTVETIPQTHHKS